MNTVIKGKWFILLGWILGLTVLLLTGPNLADLVREKGQFTIPDDSMSSFAMELLEEKNKDGDIQIAIVFHKESAMTATDEGALRQAVVNLENLKEKIGISNLLHHFDNSELEKELVSEDRKTVLMSLTLKEPTPTVDEVKKELDNALKDTNIPHAYTGDWFISEDVVKSSQDGLKKTEWITVVFILLVLLLVFRSPVAPLIPLLTVGISYVASESIVAFLVDILDFPLSNFTQIFLVVVLFGVGTDYCILLLSRYKEELTHSKSVTDAIVTTYRTAGKTVLYSALAVMIGFAVIGFSEFKLYKSASAVAIGIVVLVLALFTIVPFFMAILKTKLFWPMKGSLEHKDSKMWLLSGKFSLSRPFLTLLILGVILTPFLIFYDGKLSFDNLDEIGDKYDSVKAFKTIANSFGPGKVLPATIVLKNDEPMDNGKYLALFEQITREVNKVDGVDYVRSVTRPVGDEIDDLYVTNQVKTLDEGLEKGDEGIQQIASGLQFASTSIVSSKPKMEEAKDGESQLIDGTGELKNGMGDLQKGLVRLEQGMRQGTIGAGDLRKGLAQVKANGEQLLKASQQVESKYKEAGNHLTTLSGKYTEIEKDIKNLSQSLKEITILLSEVEKKYPELEEDSDYQKAKKMITQREQDLTKLSSGVHSLNQQLQGMTSGVKEANKAFASLNQNQKQLTAGMAELIKGLEQLEKGMMLTANGQTQAIHMLPLLSGGLNQLQDGHKQLQPGFSTLIGQLDGLRNGLDESVNGLTDLSGGLKDARDYLTQLSLVPDPQMAGWFIPDRVLESEDFQEVFDTYMSSDRKTVTFDVIFKDNPYSLEALDEVGKVEEAVKRATKETSLENVKMGIGGVSSMQADLREVSEGDYSRTVLFMLVGIGLVLLVLLRSLIMPIYLILSLIITYYMSMAVTETIFVDLLGYAGINWVVPFFAFVILIALGVDYSIFLMSRFNEHRDLHPEKAILLAMGKMGSVIISAAIILGGTFAAMIPSGVQSLLQIATIVLVGLLLYAFLFLPLFVPVMVKTFGKANWWPFIGKSSNK